MDILTYFSMATEPIPKAYLINPSQKQKLTAGNEPARSHLASGPAGTHGHIFVQCQDLCFLFLSLILLIDKWGV
jgi:hypothetical protein